MRELYLSYNTLNENIYTHKYCERWRPANMGNILLVSIHKYSSFTIIILIYNKI